jgi:hypothetical protein
VDALMGLRKTVLKLKGWPRWFRAGMLSSRCLGCARSSAFCLIGFHYEIFCETSSGWAAIDFAKTKLCIV